MWNHLERRGEIIALEKADVDFNAGNIVVRRSEWKGIIGSPKGGRERVVPMTRRLKVALRAIWHLKGPVVFCKLDGRRYKTWELREPLRDICERAGLRKVAWHVLRHTFCSHLAMRGAAPVSIQVLAGHESVSTTQRYMHLAPVMLRDTVRLLEEPAPKRDSGALEMAT